LLFLFRLSAFWNIQSFVEVFKMKKTGETVFKLTAAALAVLFAVQVPAAGASTQNRRVLEPNTLAVNAANTEDASAAIPADLPADTEPAAAGLSAAAVPPSVQPEKTAACAAGNNEISAETALQQSPAATASEPQKILPGILYDAEENIYFGPNEKGLVYIGFDYDADQNVFYTPLDPWQKAFGFNDLYDAAAVLAGIIIDNRSIHFNYDGRNWMVKLWKGQYGITCGAEVGVYTESPLIAGQYYGVDAEDFLLIDLTVFRNGEHYFTLDPQMHWWRSGYIMGDFSGPDEISIESHITFKDQAMTDAFIAAISEKSNLDDLICGVDGLRVCLEW
jgi:hypothetical protein